MTGCDPQFNITGAYFPAWLACALGGLIATALTHLLLVRQGIAPHIRPAPLVYSCLFVAYSCTIWLIFYAAT